MKKFNFRLQRLLDIKEIKEEQAQRRYAQARRARSLRMEALDEAKSAVETQHAELRESLGSSISAGDALVAHRFGLRLRRNAGEEARRLVEAEEVVSDKGKELTLAAREKQMYRSLKNRKREEYQIETVRLEQNELDDQAGQRFTAEHRNELNA